MNNRPTRPEIPALKSPPADAERTAVYRRVRVRAPDPLATIIEEVVTRPDDPRRES